MTTDTFESLILPDIQRVLDHIPPPVLEQLQTEPGIILAGGAIRSVLAKDPIRDIDIFCHSKEQAETLARSFGIKVKKTYCSYTVELEDGKIQYIFYTPFTTAEDLIAGFDFRCCGAAIYWNGQAWQGIALEGFWDDCMTKTLTFRKHPKDLDSLCPLRRALNFAKNGWSITDYTLADIVIHAITPKKEDVAIVDDAVGALGLGPIREWQPDWVRYKDPAFVMDKLAPAYK